MRVSEVQPPIDTGGLLPGMQFADAYRIEVPDRALDAHEAMQRMTARSPRWAATCCRSAILPSPRSGLKHRAKAKDRQGR